MSSRTRARRSSGPTSPDRRRALQLRELLQQRSRALRSRLPDARRLRLPNGQGEAEDHPDGASPHRDPGGPGPAVGRSWIPTAREVSLGSSGVRRCSVTRKPCPCWSSADLRGGEAVDRQLDSSEVAGSITRAMATWGGIPTANSTSLSPDQGICHRNSSVCRPGGNVPRSLPCSSDLVHPLVAHVGLRVERRDPGRQLHEHAVGLPGRAARGCRSSAPLRPGCDCRASRRAIVASDDDERLLHVARDRVDVQDHVHRLGLPQLERRARRTHHPGTRCSRGTRCCWRCRGC